MTREERALIEALLESFGVSYVHATLRISGIDYKREQIAAICHEMNAAGRKSPVGRPKQSAQPSPRPNAPTAPEPPEKQWCQQCDALVATVRAKTCTSAFCSLRRKAA